MSDTGRKFIPAAGVDWLLPLYDPLQKLFGGEADRRRLIDEAELRPGQRVLDIGCGTGSLVVLVKRLHPRVEVVGLDPDPKALARAERKVQRGRLEVQLDHGFSDDLPYPEASFDRVFSSYMFHHLEANEKAKTMREVRRVLRPGGSLHLADFGGSEARGDGLLARFVHGHAHVEGQFGGALPALMREAGLADASEVGHRATLFGRVARYRAAR